MKNAEKAAMPISAIVQCEFLPCRLSAKPAQVVRTLPSKSVKTVTPSLNQKSIQRDRPRPKKIPQSQNENCWSDPSNSKWPRRWRFFDFHGIGFLIQGQGADSRPALERPQGRLRRLSGQAEGRGRVYDGR